MGNFLTHKYSGLLAHRMAICLFLALFILSFGGVGDIRTTSLLGLILCMAGSMQPSARVDLCIWIPLFLYNLFSMASSYAVYGNITEGYASTQMIFPVLYLLMACLDQKELLLLRRLCASWAAVVAAVGIFQFVKQAVLQGSVSRLSGVLGNPNATGIFLVLSWFVLMDCLPESQENRIAMLLHCLEPILLIATALTLSMGSFAAMAVGIFVFAVQKRKNTTGKETIYAVFCLLARASLGIGTGILLYLAAARTDFPWICIPLLLYSIFMVFCWPDFINFLAEFQKSAVAISTIGVLAAIAAIIIRSGAVSTFIERFEMMHSGMKYLMVNPLLGVGPYQWRMLDLQDGGKYFNTWHIHNILIHTGVELGLIAMAMLIAIFICFCLKRKSPAAKAAFFAFVLHNMMDTSFFYLGITAFLLLSVSEPQKGGKIIHTSILRIFYGVFAIFFAYNLYFFLHMGQGGV